MNSDDANAIVAHASHIGDILERNHPAVSADPAHGAVCIADKDVEDVAATITLVVAQILQSWLNAGSERDVTLEELGPAIEDHVRGWAC